MRFHTAALFPAEYQPHCHFGITEAALGASLGASLGGALGIGEAAGGILAGGLEGAALGAGSTLITGGDPLMGALTGGITGGAIPAFGPALGEATGLGALGGDILAGAAAGGVGSLVTGGNPLMGALTGGAGGAFAGISGGSNITGGTAEIAGAPATGTGGGTSAAATAGMAPAGGAPVDLTSTFGLDTFGVPDYSAAGTAGFAGSGTGGAAVNTGPGGPSGGGGGVGGDFGGGGTGPAATEGGAGGIGSKIMGLVEKNPGVLLAGGLLGANMLMGNKPLPAEAAIQQNAGEAGTMARTLTAYQTTGTLPPGLQSVVDQQVNAAKAALVSQYGDLGLGHSTMLTDKLNQLKAQKSAEIATFADNLAKQGVQWANMSAQEFNALLNAQTAQEADFSKSLGLFAAGLAGMRPSGGTAA